MRINSRKIRKILGRIWSTPRRIFETFCTQEAPRCIGMNATHRTFYLIQKIIQRFSWNGPKSPWPDRPRRTGPAHFCGYTLAFWARARPTPSPPTNLTRRAWAEILKPAKKIWLEPGPKCCFQLFYTIKCVGDQPGPGPSPTRKLRPDASSGMVMGRIFSSRNNKKNFSSARKMLRSICGGSSPLWTRVASGY
jgi:hypothetical protein